MVQGDSQCGLLTTEESAAELLSWWRSRGNAQRWPNVREGMDYCLGNDDGAAAIWNGQPNLDLDGDGRLDAIGLGLDGDGMQDDALADFDGDGMADHAVMTLIVVVRISKEIEQPQWHGKPFRCTACIGVGIRR